MGDNTVLCVVYILTKWRGKTSLLGGCGSMKKRGGDMHYMNGCGGELRKAYPVYGLVILLRLLLAACVCYLPVAQTRCRSDSGLGGGN